MFKITDTKEIERLEAMKRYNILEIDFDFEYIIESILEICDVSFCSIVAIYKDNYHVIASVERLIYLRGFDFQLFFDS